MIAIGCDHAGLSLKNAIIDHLKSRNTPYKDFGTDSAASCHYIDFAKGVAQSVAEGECEKGILVCGTGVGMSMAANKIRGIRAACCSDCFSAAATRSHNDANIICLGERVIGSGLAAMIVDLFLDTPFEGGRHKLRVDMLSELEG